MSWLYKHIFKSWNSRRLAYCILVAVSIPIIIVTFAKLGWVQAFGWIYSGAFALSALPQSLRSIKDGHSRGVADGTLALWIIGELTGLVYGFGLAQLPIIFNCLVNTVFVGVIIYYRLWPKDRSGIIEPSTQKE